MPECVARLAASALFRGSSVLRSGSSGTAPPPPRPFSCPRSRSTRRARSSARPAPDDAVPLQAALQGTLPIVTDQFATVTVVPSAEIQRSTGGNARRRAAIQARHHLVRLRAGRGEPPRGARPRQLSRPHPGERARRQRRVGPQRRPRRADRSTVGAADRSDPRTGDVALRLAGDRRRGQRRQQPHSDLHPAARLCRRSQRRAQQRRQRRRGRGAARRRQGQLRVPRRRVQPHRGRTTASRAILICFRPIRAPLVGNRQPNSSVRADGQSVGGSYIFNSGFVGVAVSRFGSFYRMPGIEATETGARIDLNQTKVTSKGEFRPRLVRDRHRCGSGPAPPTTSTTNWPTRTASTASSRPSPTARRKAASRSSSCRSTCGLPR